MLKWILFDLFVHFALATLVTWVFMRAMGMAITPHSFALWWCGAGVAVMVIDHTRGKRGNREQP